MELFFVVEKSGCKGITRALNISNAPANQEILPMQILLLAALTTAISGIGRLLNFSKSKH